MVEKTMAGNNDICPLCKSDISKNYQNLLSISGYLLVILFISCSFIDNANAESHADEEDHFDGSEYNASSFKDISFAKQDYKELRATASVLRPLSKEGESDLQGDSRGTLLKKRQNDKGIRPVGVGNKKADAENSGRITEAEHIVPVEDLAGDWVPNKIDLTSNGAFGVIPDNGSPVPYRLNGHVDIERGKP